MTAPNSAEVAKARLSKISPKAKDKAEALKGEGAIEVQFNPTSLKFSRQNNPDSSKTTNSQERQHTGPQSATLTFDLEFDTGEIPGKDPHTPQDVRELTAAVRKFVLPSGDNKTEAPPGILFEWGPLHFPGIVTSLTEDIDYFAPNGTPLRAKLSVTIVELDPKFEDNAEGQGARRADSATKPGEPPPGTRPGTRGTVSPTSVEIANAGESVQELLTRIGADPAAWRAAMNRLTSPIGLTAGTQVQLDSGTAAGLTAEAGVGASMGAGAGLGVSAGFSASAGVSAQAALSSALGISASAGADASIGVGAGAAGAVSAELSTIASFGGSVGVTAGGSVGASEQMSAGFVLSAGGGVTASANLVVAGQVDAAVTTARASFDVPAAQVGGSLGVPAIGLPSVAAALVDARATSYGRSIPLRARAPAVTVTGVAAGGQVSVSARAQRSEIVVSPSGAPWQKLTDDGGWRSSTDVLQRSRDDGPTTMRWTPGR